jgi:hypothetical protein
MPRALVAPGLVFVWPGSTAIAKVLRSHASAAGPAAAGRSSARQRTAARIVSAPRARDLLARRDAGRLAIDRSPVQPVSATPAWLPPLAGLLQR